MNTSKIKTTEKKYNIWKYKKILKEKIEYIYEQNKKEAYPINTNGEKKLYNILEECIEDIMRFCNKNELYFEFKVVCNFNNFEGILFFISKKKRQFEPQQLLIRTDGQIIGYNKNYNMDDYTSIYPIIKKMFKDIDKENDGNIKYVKNDIIFRVMSYLKNK